MQLLHDVTPCRRGGLFSPADALRVFCADFLDADRCAAVVMERLHGDSADCPRCGEPLSDARRRTFRAWGRVMCAKCNKWFSATTGTHYCSAKISPSQLVLMSYLLGIGVEAGIIATAVGVEPGTVQYWRLKFQALEDSK